MTAQAAGPAPVLVSRVLKAERRAVTVLFLVTGVLFADFLSRLPEVKDRLGLSEGQLGFALLGIGVGGFVGSLMTRWVVPRVGTRRVLLGS